MQELEAKCLANSGEAANLLENRLANLENRSNSDKDNLREVFAGGLAAWPTASRPCTRAKWGKERAPVVRHPGGHSLSSVIPADDR